VSAAHVNVFVSIIEHQGTIGALMQRSETEPQEIYEIRKTNFCCILLARTKQDRQSEQLEYLHGYETSYRRYSFSLPIDLEAIRMFRLLAPNFSSLEEIIRQNLQCMHMACTIPQLRSYTSSPTFYCSTCLARHKLFAHSSGHYILLHYVC